VRTRLLFLFTVALLVAFNLFNPAVFAQNDDDSSAQNIALQIKENDKFENFPDYILDAISADEIDAYQVSFVVTRAPEDIAAFGSPSNVARLKQALIDNHDMNVRSSSSGSVRTTVPIEELLKIAQYDFVDRVVGDDFGFKYLSEESEGILKVNFDNTLYDLPYSIINGKLYSFSLLMFGVYPEGEGILEISIPNELYDYVEGNEGFVNLEGIIEQEGEHEKIPTEDFVKIIWNFPDDPNFSTLQLFSNVRPSHTEPNEIIKDPSVIPTWVRNNASWWSSDQIDDSNFVLGIQYLISQEIMKIPPTISTGNSEISEIPPWVKNNAKWWANGQISDDEFVHGIEYLIKHGIIKI